MKINKDVIYNLNLDGHGEEKYSFQIELKNKE